MYNVIVTKEAEIEPVSVAEAKDFCRVDVADDDKLIANLIKAARTASEHYTGRAYIEQTLTWTATTAANVAFMPRPPHNKVNSVKVLDGHTWVPLVLDTDYKVITYGPFMGVYLLSTPSAATGDISLQVEYEAGYGSDAASVPEALRQAILHRVAAAYDARGGERAGLQNAKSLEAPYKKVLP